MSFPIIYVGIFKGYFCCNILFPWNNIQRFDGHGVNHWLSLDSVVLFLLLVQYECSGFGLTRVIPFDERDTPHM